MARYDSKRIAIARAIMYKENEASIAYYNNLCNRYSRTYHEIKELRNKLKGNKNNENQN